VPPFKKKKELQMKEMEAAAKLLAAEQLTTTIPVGSQPRNSTSKNLKTDEEKRKQGPKSKEPLASPAPQLSDYEKQIQKNVEERKKMFEMMISGPKKEFLEALQASSSKKKSVKRQRDSTE